MLHIKSNQHFHFENMEYMEGHTPFKGCQETPDGVEELLPSETAGNLKSISYVPRRSR